MTKAQKAERAEAIVDLRTYIKPGDTVYTILENVSRSGMSRTIRVCVPLVGSNGKADFLHPNHSVALAIGARRAKKGDGIVMGGCGMDMGFALVYELSHALYPEYPCSGKGLCPSNYHTNHHDRIRCEGTIVHNPDGPDFGQRCYTPGGGFFGPAREIPAEWPRRIVTVRGKKIEAGPLSCITDENGENPIVCPVCQGDGYVPNPEGPERFDLVHTDGYALHQRWL